MPHNYNSSSANAANAGPNHQPYPPTQPYCRANGDGLQLEVNNPFILNNNKLLFKYYLYYSESVSKRIKYFLRYFYKFWLIINYFYFYVFRKNRYNLIRHICVAHHWKLKLWFTILKMWLNSFSTIGVHFLLFFHRRYHQHLQMARIRWHVRSIT